MILKFSDFSTRKAASLVCRVFKHEAAIWLWRSVRLSNDDRYDDKHARRCLPEQAHAIKRVSVRFICDSPDTVADLCVFQDILKSMQVLAGLEDLDLSIEHPPDLRKEDSSILEILCTTSMSFKLKRLKISAGTDYLARARTINKLWQHHPTLESCTLFLNLEQPNQLIHTELTRLSYLLMLGAEGLRIGVGSPLAEIHIEDANLRNPTILGGFVTVMESFSGTLTELDIHVPVESGSDHWGGFVADTDIIHSLLHLNLPCLQSLCIDFRLYGPTVLRILPFDRAEQELIVLSISSAVQKCLLGNLYKLSIIGRPFRAEDSAGFIRLCFGKLHRMETLAFIEMDELGEELGYTDAYRLSRSEAMPMLAAVSTEVNYHDVASGSRMLISFP